MENQTLEDITETDDDELMGILIPEDQIEMKPVLKKEKKPRKTTKKEKGKENEDKDSSSGSLQIELDF